LAYPIHETVIRAKRGIWVPASHDNTDDEGKNLDPSLRSG
jgi:hypothetical protein